MRTRPDPARQALHIPTGEPMLVDREKRAHVELKVLQTKYRERVTSSLRAFLHFSLSSNLC